MTYVTKLLAWLGMTPRKTTQVTAEQPLGAEGPAGAPNPSPPAGDS
jgi:hypothetical protein